MIINKTLSPVPFYANKKYWHSNKWYVYGQKCPIPMLANQTLPFQVNINSTSLSLSQFNIRRVEDNSVARAVNVEGNYNLILQDSYSIVQIKSCAIEDLPLGLYYYELVLSDGTSLISDIISIIDNISNYLRIVYKNNENLYFSNGHIDFSNDFAFELFVRSTIGKPEYEYEEELTKRLGYKFVESQISNKVYKFTFPATEALCDAYRLVRICDYIRIESFNADFSEFQHFNVLYFTSSVDWEDNGDIATVETSFETDSIVQKLQDYSRTQIVNFYNALLSNSDEALKFDDATIAQYYNDYIESINGKMIRELDFASDISDDTVIVVDENQGLGPAKKLRLKETLKTNFEKFLANIKNLIIKGSITTTKIIIGDGTIEWDPENKGFKVTGGLWTDSYLSTKGANPNTGGNEGSATTLGGLRNVAANADSTYDVAKMLVLEAKSNLWTLKNLSDLVGGLDEAELEQYLTNNEYAKKSDIPSLSGYATEQWVLGKGYATTSDLDSRIDALVNGAPQAYDTLKEIADVLAGNVNSISDILTALGNKAEKATTLGGYGITDAYTITQIDSIVNGLSGNISTLQGYFTDGVANSALKLSDNGSYTAWGQTFFTNGKPKSVSGALTDVTDITSSGTITTNKIIIGNGTIEWDETNKGFKVTGLYSTTYLSAKGANSSGGSSNGGGLITSLYRYSDLGKTFSDTSNDTFNAYTINKINADLGSRISVLEGKATNVSFTQALTSGTQIGSISIDGVTKNIYAPAIPTSDINKGVTAYGWGNHASIGYLLKSGGTMTGNLTMGSSDNNEWIPVEFNRGGYKGFIGVGANQLEIGSLDGYIRISPTDLTYLTNNSVKTIWHSGNFTPSDYLPLSGGTLSGNNFNTLHINSNDSSIKRSAIVFEYNKVTKTQIGWDEYQGMGTYLYNYASNVFLGIKDDGIPYYYNGTHNTIIHSGNIGSQSVANADKLGGYYAKASNTPFDGIPVIRGDGVMEIGKYIDFHNDNTSNNDYDCRLQVQGNYKNTVHLPTSSGILALLTDNVASANKLSDNSAFTAWGQIFFDVGKPRSISGVLSEVTQITFDSAKSYGLFRGNYYTSALSANDLVVYNPIISLQGNVGIGTYNPQYKLDINGDIAFSSTSAKVGIEYGGGNTSLFNYIQFNVDAIKYYSGGWTSGNHAAHQFITGNQETRMVIMNDGNVGIGTSNPLYKLDVRNSATSSYDFHVYNAATNSSFFVGNDTLWYGTSKTSGTIFSINKGCSYDGGGGTPVLSVDANGALAVSGAATFGSSITSSGSIESTAGHIIAYGQIRLSGTGSNYSGLFLSNYITSGGLTEDIWLYNSSRIFLYGSEIRVACNLVPNSNGQHILGNINNRWKYIYGVDCDFSGAATFGGHVSIVSNDWCEFSVTRGNVGVSSIGGIDGNGVYFAHTQNSVTTYMYLKSGKGLSVYGTLYSSVGIWSDGYVSAKGQNTSSDMRLKNVLNDVVLSVKDIANAPSMRFSWKNGGGVDVGSSAQYWQLLLPDAVKERDGMLEMQYANIALLSAIALAKNFETHEERIARLERENKELRNEINMMKGGNYA